MDRKRGGLTYSVRIGIDIDDDLNVGNQNDYVAKAYWSGSVSIDGDLRISLSAADFELVQLY